MKRTYYREINGHNFSRFREGNEAIYFFDNQKVSREVFQGLVVFHMKIEMEAI